MRTNVAADVLGVSPNTLRSWERRFGYPAPRRTDGGHRLYELSDLEALKAALLETHNISSAIELARRRGEGPTTPNRLVEAFDRLDEGAADRLLEESLAVRSIERTLEEVLLPALELAFSRRPNGPEYEAACRWATGWLHAVRRAAAPPTRDAGVLVFDSSVRLGSESLHVQALELAIRRAGFKTLLLSIDLEHERAARALRALEPAVIVLAGSDATLDVLGRLVYARRLAVPQARVVEYRGAAPVSGSDGIATLGTGLAEALETLRAMVDGRPQLGDIVVTRNARQGSARERDARPGTAGAPAAAAR